MVTTTTPWDQRVSICTCTWMGRHLATFTSRPGSSLYTLATEPPQVAASTQVSAYPPALACPTLPSLRRVAAARRSSLLLISPDDCSPADSPRGCVGPSPRQWHGQERYFLLVVDDYTRYTTVFPLHSKDEVPYILIPWIRIVCLQLRERFRKDLPVLRLHSDRGGEFSSDLLRDFCRGDGILQSFTLSVSPQKNGIAERRIGLVKEVACTSMIHAAAPHFLWPFAVRYAAHQLNLWPRVSLAETSLTVRWTGEVGDASVFQVWGSRAFVRDTSADKLSARAIPCVFLGFPLDGPAPSGVSQVDPLLGTVPVEVAVASAWGAEPAGAEPRGAESEGAGSGGARPAGAEPGDAEPGGAESEGAESGGVGPRGTGSSGGPAGASPRLSPRVEPLSPQQLREWFARRTRLRSGAAGAGEYTAGGTGVGCAGDTSLGVAGVPVGDGGARTRGTGAAGAGGARAGDPGVGGAGAGGTGAVDPRARVTRAAGASGVGGAGAGGAGAGGTGAGGTGAEGAGAGGAGAGDPCAGGAGAVDRRGGAAGARGDAFGGTGVGGTMQWRPFFQDSPMPAPSPYAEQTYSFTKRCEPESRPAWPVRAVHTGRRVPRPHPPTVPGTHVMALRPSSVPLRVPLQPPPESSLPSVPEPEYDLARAASTTVPHLLATVVSDPSFESSAALIAESESDRPPSVGGECALGTDVLEDRQENFECLAAVVPHLVAMLLAPKGDPDAPDIPTPRSYTEAITGPYSSQWQIAMDAQMASWKSTGTYVDAAPPIGANIVDGLWIFRGVDFFQTFSPNPKMTTLRVLLHVAAQRDYELHSLDFSIAFLQGSLHEEIWLHRPPGFTGSFLIGTQWSLRRPVYCLRHAPREWHDTLRTTLGALGFAPSTADPLLFVHTDTSLPPFYVLVYIDDLVFATADIEALALVNCKRDTPAMT
ncbi:unnamed protein product [Closterium sp. NIES-54]